MRSQRPLLPIVVAEPTHPNGEHAAINGAILQAVAAACGPVLFAATKLQHARVQEAADPAAPTPQCQDINVLPPGGVHLRRMRAQWRALAGLMREHAPRALVLLSAGPETLFVARALVIRHPKLRVFAIMHGNLADVPGWRSRDPRRRLIDLKSGLALARHPRIRLIVLEPHIRDAAARIGLRHEFLVWPLPSLAHEGAPPAPWTPGPRLRLTFVGTANRAKGFDDFLALHRGASSASAYEWSLAGKLSAEYSPEEVTGIERPAERLSRAAFIERVRQADYAVIAFRAEYELTASGSLIDCIAQRKPFIAVENPMLTALARRYGLPGHLCPDLGAAASLLSDPARLRDATAYAGFQSALDAMHRDRVPAALAPIIRRDLGC